MFWTTQKMTVAGEKGGKGTFATSIPCAKLTLPSKTDSDWHKKLDSNSFSMEMPVHDGNNEFANTGLEQGF